MSRAEPLTELLEQLPYMSDRHAPGTALHDAWREQARDQVERLFADAGETGRPLGPFGELFFPYHRMGTIDSLNLFDIEELILFSFYWYNRKRYQRVVDAGANIGLHSIIMSRCGFEVRSYEPDPEHIARLQMNLEMNDSARVAVAQAAVSTKPGRAEFIRVLGNTTGSHLAGAKPNPYGELEKFEVRLVPISELMDWADLIKLDIEGEEAKALLATSREQWESTDMLTEISNEENASTVFDHFNYLGIPLFAQKINWRRVKSLDDMPISYRDGTLFISAKEDMPWPETSAVWAKK